MVLVYIGALADAHYASGIIIVERYQAQVANESHHLLNVYDKKMIETNNFTLIDEANDAVAKMAEEKTQDALNKILLDASTHMKNGYNRADN